MLWEALMSANRRERAPNGGETSPQTRELREDLLSSIFRARKSRLDNQHNNSHENRANDGVESFQVAWNCPFGDKKRSFVDFFFAFYHPLALGIIFGIRIGCWCAGRAFGVDTKRQGAKFSC